MSTAASSTSVPLKAYGPVMFSTRRHGAARYIIPKLSANNSRRITCKQFLRHESSNASQVIFSGIQPTGVPHLGNYLGALQHWVHLQNNATPTTRLFFSIVDLHAITLRQNREDLQRWKRETLATLLAVGLDPQRSTIFFQSDVCFCHSLTLLLTPQSEILINPCLGACS